MFHGYDPANHYGRPPTLVDAGTGVVIAAEFRKMCLPRNPTTTTPSRSATTITPTTAMATRLPRPILTLLTILSIAGSLSMINQSTASIMPMPGTDARQAIACRCCATSPKRVLHAGFGGGDACVAPPEFGALADTLRRTECSCQAPP